MTDHKDVKDMKRIMWWEKSPNGGVNYKSQIDADKGWEKHHILPCVSFTKSISAVSTEPGKEWIESALKYFTNYNINKAENLIALPTVYSYQEAYGKKGNKKGTLLDLKNLPCHQTGKWGHIRYNKLVAKQLRGIWRKVEIKDQPHDFSADDVKADIAAAESTWREVLKDGRQASAQNWNKMLDGADPMVHNHFTMVFLPKRPM